MTEYTIGRPPDYKPEFCQMLIDHMAEGLSYETFAAVIKTSRKTLYNWENATYTENTAPSPDLVGAPMYPEWSAAKEEGITRCQQFWEMAGRNMMLGLKTEQKDKDGNIKSIDYTKGNATVWIFNMKNRFNWKDKVDHTTDDKPINEIVTIELPANGREPK